MNATTSTAKGTALALKIMLGAAGAIGLWVVAALTFARTAGPPEMDLLTIYRAKGIYSPESEAYLSEFLLRFGGRS